MAEDESTGGAAPAPVTPAAAAPATPAAAPATPAAGQDGQDDQDGQATRNMVRQPRVVTRLTDPRALRAMAHPIRLSLIGALRREGPLTATAAGELIGESSASCSFHLRQLAKYGLVEEAGGGKGRERPWRAAAQYTSWPDVAEGPEAAAASSLLRTVLAERYFQFLSRWIQAKPDEPEEWQQAAHFGDTMLYVTADELAALADETQAMLDRFMARQTHPELRPPGARLVAYLHLAFPGDLSGAGEHTGQPGPRNRTEPREPGQ
jgi:predicted transcriptional regulator